jgi:hypothetical protein
MSGRKLRFSFRCVFLAVTLMTAVPYLKWELEPYLKLFLLWGAVCVAADLYRGGRSLRDPSLWVLGIFCGAYAVSVFVNRSSNFSANLRNLLYMVIVFLVCYGDARSMGGTCDERSAQKRKKDVSSGKKIRAAHAVASDSSHVGQYDGSYAGQPDSGYAGQYDGSHAGQLDNSHAGQPGGNYAGQPGGSHAGQSDSNYTGISRESEGIVREFRTYLRLMSVGTFLLSMVCLATYIFKINVMYVRGERRGYLGYWDDRLWGLYNANTNGFICAVSILISIFFIVWGLVRRRRDVSGRRNKTGLVFDVINIILQTICLSASYSRTSIIALAGGVMLIVFLAWGMVKKPASAEELIPVEKQASAEELDPVAGDCPATGDGNRVGSAILKASPRRAGSKVAAALSKRLLMAVLAGIAVMFVCMGLHTFLSAVYVKPDVNPLIVIVSADRGKVMAAEIEAVGNAEDEAGGKAEDEAGGKVEDETGEEAEDEASGNAEEASREDKRYDAWGRELREGEDGMLTGRPMLWLAGFRTFLEAPVFGVTRENLSQRVGENLSDKGWMPDLEAGGIHNGPLTVLVCSGLAGFVPLLAFAVMLLRRFTRALLPLLTGHTDRVTGSEAEIAALAGAVILVIMFMAAEMTESRILYQVNAFFVFFWTVCGYASTIGRSFKKES